MRTRVRACVRSVKHALLLDLRECYSYSCSALSAFNAVAKLNPATHSFAVWQAEASSEKFAVGAASTGSRRAINTLRAVNLEAWHLGCGWLFCR